MTRLSGLFIFVAISLIFLNSSICYSAGDIPVPDNKIELKESVADEKIMPVPPAAVPQNDDAGQDTKPKELVVEEPVIEKSIDDTEIEMVNKQNLEENDTKDYNKAESDVIFNNILEPLTESLVEDEKKEKTPQNIDKDEEEALSAIIKGLPDTKKDDQNLNDIKNTLVNHTKDKIFSHGDDKINIDKEAKAAGILAPEPEKSMLLEFIGQDSKKAEKVITACGVSMDSKKVKEFFEHSESTYLDTIKTGNASSITGKVLFMQKRFFKGGSILCLDRIGSNVVLPEAAFKDTFFITKEIDGRTELDKHLTGLLMTYSATQIAQEGKADILIKLPNGDAERARLWLDMYQPYIIHMKHNVMKKGEFSLDDYSGRTIFIYGNSRLNKRISMKKDLMDIDINKY